MREKLNSDPKTQVAAVAILIVLAAFFFISKSGGEEEAATEEPVAAEVTGVSTEPVEGVEGVEGIEPTAAPAAVPGVPTDLEAPAPPAPVTAAYKGGETVVLLIVRDSGVDDGLVKRSASALSSMESVALFVVPVSQISRYSAITLGVEVSRVPALVVMSPRGLSKGGPEAAVSYGFQTEQTIVQAVRDADYSGPVATYHPD